jgi:hypothetical protein
MQVQHLKDLQRLIDESGPTIALDLEELMLVDLDAARFSGRCPKPWRVAAPLLAIHQGLDRERRGRR